MDRAAFDSFFSALKNLQQDRKLEGAQGGQEAFGFQKPSLKIRIQAGDQWTELLMGEKNPTGESRYAKTSAGGDIFLVAQRSWDALNKSLKDLRKKELFSWQPEQVVAMNVAWRNGQNIRVERLEGGKEWKEAGRPDLKVKASKVEDLLDQLHWLRAVDFLEEGSGSNPPAVTIGLQLKNGQAVEIKLGDADPQTRQAVAEVTGNPVPVKVSTYFMKDIPNSPDFLADRSLLPGEPDAVTRVTWKMGESKGTVVKIDENTWGTGPDEAKPKPLQDSHAVRLLLGDAGSIEYTEAAEPVADFPADAPNSIEFRAGDKKLASMAWTKFPDVKGETASIRLEKNGETRMVKLDYESADRIKASLDELVKTVQGKQ